MSGPQKDYPVSVKIIEDSSEALEIPMVDFAKCSKIIEQYIQDISRERKPPEELPLKAIFAFSYYYDKASQAGLIDFYKGGQVKVCICIFVTYPQKPEKLQLFLSQNI